MEVLRTLHSHHVRFIGAIAPLSFETERDLCIRWRDHHDTSAAHQLAGSHLHLVVETAWAYRGFGVQQDDLIGEGHIGLMKAVCRFDPDCGLRFPSYARWWVHAAIQEHLMHNGSVANEGAADRDEQLPSNLQRLRGSLPDFDNSMGRTDDASPVAAHQDVREQKVVSTDRCMVGPDISFNPSTHADKTGEYESWVVDHTDGQERSLVEREGVTWRNSLRFPASEHLDPRGTAIGARGANE